MHQTKAGEIALIFGTGLPNLRTWHLSPWVPEDQERRIALFRLEHVQVGSRVVVRMDEQLGDSTLIYGTVESTKSQTSERTVMVKMDKTEQTYPIAIHRVTLRGPTFLCDSSENLVE